MTSRRRRAALDARAARIDATTAEAAKLRQIITEATDPEPGPAPGMPSDPPTPPAAVDIEGYLADHRRIFPNSPVYRTKTTGP